MKEKLQKEIKTILVELGITDPVVNFDISKSTDFGDMSSNVAMMYAKQIDRKSLDLAGEIKDGLVSKNIEHISKIEVASPGFINFFFDPKYFSDQIGIALKDDYGKNTNLKGQKIIIEYTVCNVLKPMHIGHLMGNVVGESISRIIENSNAIVKRNNYQGDSGLHVAKAVWGISKLGGKIDGSLTEKTTYIGNSYAKGAQAYDDDEQSKTEIKEINKKIYDKSDPKLLDLYRWGRAVSLEHFEELYKKLGTKFDFYFFESEVVDDALKIVREFLKTGLFEESDGAIIFRAEQYDPKLHTRVFITSEGFPTYEAKDIAHAIRKHETYKFDKSIIVTANEQDEYFKVMLRALQEIKPDIALKTIHISHGLLKFPGGKMSSRKGNVITGETLISDVTDLIQEKMKDREMSKTVFDTISEQIAIGAIKYSILRQAIGGDIVFDFDKSISFEGDSGPYLQYATVRANSLMKKAEKAHRGKASVSLEVRLPSGWETTNLERLIERFPDVVVRAGVEYAPHHIVTYLIDLAGEFNSFYASHKIIDETDPASPYRLTITQAFKNIMTSGLDLLGIKVPEEM